MYISRMTEGAGNSVADALDEAPPVDDQLRLATPDKHQRPTHVAHIEGLVVLVQYQDWRLYRGRTAHPGLPRASPTGEAETQGRILLPA